VGIWLRLDGVGAALVFAIVATGIGAVGLVSILLSP
jgi:hypothetical protein